MKNLKLQLLRFVLFFLSLIQNVSCNEPSSSGSFTQSTKRFLSTNQCSIEDQLGQTYYLTVSSLCLKIDLFIFGSVSIDSSNSDCTKENASNQLSILANYQNSTDHVAYYDKADGWNGIVYFGEDTSISETSVNPKKIDNTSQEFELEILLPSCTLLTEAPSSNPSLSPSPTVSPQPSISTNCFTGIYQGETFYFSSQFFCVRADLFEGGIVAIDKQNVDCTEQGASSDLEIIGTYQTQTNKDFYFGGDFTGRVYYVEDETVTETTTNIIAFSQSTKTFIFEIRMRHCAEPSTVPTLIPTVAPSISILPSLLPSSLPSGQPSALPTIQPSFT